MLKRVDRIQVAVRDSERAAEPWRALLGAEPVREGAVESLRAHRTVLQLGASEVELLAPTGPGPVADFLGAWGGGIFAAGFSVGDLGAMRERLVDAGVRWTEEGEQIFVDGAETEGLPAVLGPMAERSPVGALRGLYEVTHLVRSWKQTQETHTRIFGLEPDRFSELESEGYGYTGTLLLFDPPARLDRIELSEITQPEKAMGRFFARRGPSIYMCYAECDDMAALVERLRSTGARFAVPSGDADPPNLFVHPSSLGGVLLGVSRTHHAWTWSGRPELAKG